MKVKKVRKYRGSKTHGGGAMKKRRGAGSRGGRGRAGSGKRADVRKPSYWKTWQMGKHGFNSPTRVEPITVNVSDLEKQLATFEAKGAATKKGSAWTVDLTKSGVDKLLGSGKVSAKLTVTVSAASKSAIEKIEAAGGSVVLPAQEVVGEAEATQA